MSGRRVSFNLSVLNHVSRHKNSSLGIEIGEKHVCLNRIMDESLYDEFGNYLGPELPSSDNEEEDEQNDIPPGELSPKDEQPSPGEPSMELMEVDGKFLALYITHNPLNLPEPLILIFSQSSSIP